ncbi:MAG: DUF4810 domain-containing protein [Pseudobdellovibrio sp.]
MNINCPNLSKPLIKMLGLALLALAFFTSCANKTIYYWGEYEELIYTQYQEPEKATPEIQIEKMNADIQKAASENKPLPPGFYAHLGYQYLQTGKAVEARQCFVTEKKNFPESAVLMNRFLKKIK